MKIVIATDDARFGHRSASFGNKTLLNSAIDYREKSEREFWPALAQPESSGKFSGEDAIGGEVGAEDP